MYTRPPARRRSNRIRSRRFIRGWNGWVTTIESELMLDNCALCADRRYAKRPPPSISFRNVRAAYRLWPILPIVDTIAQVPDIGFQVLRVFHDRHPVYAGAGRTP